MSLPNYADPTRRRTTERDTTACAADRGSVPRDCARVVTLYYRTSTPGLEIVGYTRVNEHVRQGHASIVDHGALIITVQLTRRVPGHQCIGPSPASNTLALTARGFI
jgi:hypothetical protein